MSDHQKHADSPEGNRALVYKGALIADRGAMLSLTDMWRAAGCDPARQPSNWLGSAEARRFIEFFADVLNPRDSGIDALVQTARGGRAPGTFAHWQIALAYAKYLSPEFHMWCNEVVRDRMEQRSLPAATTAAATVAAVVEEVRRCIGGIVQAAVYAELQVMLPAMVQAEVSSQTHKMVVDHLTVGEVLDMEKVPSAGRRGLINAAASRLRKFCERQEIVPRQLKVGRYCAYVYSREIATAWLQEEGRRLIRRHRSRRAGQGELRLIQGGKKAG